MIEENDIIHDDPEEDVNPERRPVDVKVVMKVYFSIPNGCEFIEDPKNYTPSELCRIVEDSLMEWGMENVVASPIKIENYYG